MILSAGCAGVIAAAGPFTWGVAYRPGWGAYLAFWGALARRCVVAYWAYRPGGAWWLIGRIGPAVRWPAYWAYRPGGALFGALARAGNAAPHKKALVFFINAGKFLADGGRLAIFGGHITHNARAGVCFAALRE